MSGITKKNIDQSLKFVYSDNNSLSVIFHDNNLLMGVVGEFNKNLQELEKITSCSLYSRGNSILIKSTPEKNEKIKNAIQFLANQFINNGSIENKDIISSVDNFMINEKVKNNNITDIIKTPKKSIIPRSEKQKSYVRALRESDIVISGFLPGDMKEKVDPYLRPLYDSLYDLFDFEKIQRMIEIGDIEIAPLAFMRGRTLKNSFAILDEAQNATDTQIKMFLTRIGENSKIVVNGDPSQIDLPNKSMSGLVRSKELLGHLKEISIVDFDHSDVVRHPLVSKIVKAYSNND